jgi:malonyl-CoA/methylmalonyl-CoA synthetase
MLQLFENALRLPKKIAVIDTAGFHTFEELLKKSAAVASYLLQGKSDLNEAPVAFMVSPGFDYVAVQWGIWRAGGIAVPLCISYPFPSLQYVVEDTGAKSIVYGPEYAEILAPFRTAKGLRMIEISDIPESAVADLPEVGLDRSAMILYTSGTTSLPKGVLTTHANIQSQVSTLVKAWEWTEKDHTLCLLPLHHVHGIINVVSCALWSGATVQFLHPFDAARVFQIFLEGKVNVFMAVPTIYFKLISHYESLDESQKKSISDCLANFRLMISGSAALPVSVMEKWQAISSHYLLERYGMTEIGMAISNPLHGQRKAGYIGMPLPGVEVRVCDESDKEIRNQPGEIQIKGPSVFREYWGKPEATRKSFTADGWFKTGDVAVVEDRYFRILGRDSIDIIKSGGYKISALEIEEILRTHPEISDCAVVGVPDEEWGELVAAALIADDGLDIKALNAWIREKMPAYKTPRQYRILSELPRNAMGKVTKNELKNLFQK